MCLIFRLPNFDISPVQIVGRPAMLHDAAGLHSCENTYLPYCERLWIFVGYPSKCWTLLISVLFCRTGRRRCKGAMRVDYVWSCMHI